VSRLYDALRKVEEQSRESTANPSKTIVAPAKKPDQLLAVPSLQAHISSESRLIVSSDPHSPGSERFRLIRMALRNAAGGKLPKVLLITSPLPKDGKSTVSLNLATSLSEGGKHRVILLEADLHRPSLVDTLGLERMNGLSEVLKGLEEPSAVIRRIEPLDIYLMAAGRLFDHPSEMFQGERFSELLQELRACFECVLIDCPPRLSARGRCGVESPCRWSLAGRPGRRYAPRSRARNPSIVQAGAGAGLDPQRGRRAEPTLRQVLLSQGFSVGFRALQWQGRGRLVPARAVMDRLAGSANP